MKLEPFLRTLSIQNKQRGVVPLVPNHAQQAVIREVEYQHSIAKPIRIITLKARQIGFSTITEGINFAFCFLYPNTRALIVAHEDDSNQHLLGMTTHYWETWDFKRLYHTKYAGRKHLEWIETGSGINVVTAGGRGGGRSRTIHFLHASEVGFWPDPDTLMVGLAQTVPELPGTFIMLESTANGVGNYFHTMWNNSVAGDNEYVPIFAPWWWHPEYVLPDVPIMHLTEDERVLKVLMSAGMRVNERLTIPPVPREELNARLAWRRWMIANKLNNDLLKFQQEYPATPEEAFIATGQNIFPLTSLKRCYRPEEGFTGYLTRDPFSSRLTFTRDPSGPLTIFRSPSGDWDAGRYFVAGDPTHTTRGDFACAQVINRRTLEQVAVLRKRVDPMHFAKDLADLAHFYNDAWLVTESTGPGYATIGALMEMGYPNIWQARWADKTPGNIADQYGFATNVQRKHWAIGMLLNLVVNGSITIHHRVTFDEMTNYVTQNNGGFGPADEKNGHDDTVMALAIDVLCHLTEPPLPPYGAMQPLHEIRMAANEVKHLIMAERREQEVPDYDYEEGFS